MLTIYSLKGLNKNYFNNFVALARLSILNRNIIIVTDMIVCNFVKGTQKICEFQKWKLYNRAFQQRFRFLIRGNFGRGDNIVYYNVFNSKRKSHKNT